MGAAGHQPVDGFGLVMDAMEVPEKGDFVAPAMPPLGTDVTNDHRQSETKRQGDGGKPMEEA
jgi:hypothetical protein